MSSRDKKSLVASLRCRFKRSLSFQSSRPCEPYLTLPVPAPIDEGIGLPDENSSRVELLRVLPTEITLHIFSHLDRSTLLTASTVCKQFNTLVNQNIYWKRLYLSQPFWRVKQNTPKSIDWKKLYINRFELERRWKKGLASPKYVRGHTDSVYCAQFDCEKIISGSRDKSINIWDLKTGHLIKSLARPQHDSHTASVLCLQFDDEIMVSGSSDYGIIIWDIQKFRILRKLFGHTAGVLDVKHNSGTIVSCSKDTSIIVWSRKGDLIRRLMGHRGPVNAIQLAGEIVVSASGDAVIKMWNTGTGECLKEFHGHTRGLACLQYDPVLGLIASGGNDQTLRIWDSKTGQATHLLESHRQLVRTLHMSNGRIVSASYDQSIKVWDYTTGRLELDFPKWHNSWIFSVQSSADRIVSASQDHSILVLNFGEGLDLGYID
ncbi:F-box/WD repeat-containing protein 11 [Neolecta irregularis DAH-3]|uniref:F-box/WD repeat-containing protein 11 n=1 Tax=Neolecta irregularis (strain DAH-3) TaxID=1198029 RepID=A0A1U7LLL5_NEOID|nr:F-box/WD repeat-containing protein 11 [Neolecta irregularis DAH-3]|eukprot:OLL23556.1 F-box/WD repeat-containing protein 11 [Neolecta irregularis DAH-3]